MSLESSVATEVSLSELIDMVGDDLDTLREIIESFLDDAPNLIQAIADSIQTSDAPLAERSAHTLKSSSRIFQAEQFAKQCQAIEDAAREVNWEQVKPLFLSVQANYQEIAQTLIHKLEQM